MMQTLRISNIVQGTSKASITKQWLSYTTESNEKSLTWIENSSKERFSQRYLVIELPITSASKVDIKADTRTSSELHIESIETKNNEQGSLREQLRQKLLLANSLVTSIEIPTPMIRLSTSEILTIGQLPPDTPSSTELIDEDRGTY